MNVTVSISDAKVSADPTTVLTTYSLGSCIGITLYDPKERVGGMLHFQLPTSTLDAERARQNPLMFADTGFAQLLRETQLAGAEKRRLKICIAGAAQMLAGHAVFDIGRRNHAAIRKILWQQGMFVANEHVGGNKPRTMQLSIADGSVTLKMAQDVIKFGM